MAMDAAASQSQIGLSFIINPARSNNVVAAPTTLGRTARGAPADIIHSYTGLYKNHVAAATAAPSTRKIGGEAIYFLNVLA